MAEIFGVLPGARSFTLVAVAGLDEKPQMSHTKSVIIQAPLNRVLRQRPTWLAGRSFSAHPLQSICDASAVGRQGQVACRFGEFL